MNAKWTLDKNGTLKITGSGKVTSAPWSKYADRVKKISIGDSITSIPKNAFRDCYKATQATIGKKVKEIKAGAFKDCEKLKTIIFNGKALKKVGTKAFYGIASKAGVGTVEVTVSRPCWPPTKSSCRKPTRRRRPSSKRSNPLTSC